jgi:hypothetical protein
LRRLAALACTILVKINIDISCNRNAAFMRILRRRTDGLLACAGPSLDQPLWRGSHEVDQGKTDGGDLHRHRRAHVSHFGILKNNVAFAKKKSNF